MNYLIKAWNIAFETVGAASRPMVMDCVPEHTPIHCFVHVCTATASHILRHFHFYVVNWVFSLTVATARALLASQHGPQLVSAIVANLPQCLSAVVRVSIPASLFLRGVLMLIDLSTQKQESSTHSLDNNCCYVQRRSPLIMLFLNKMPLHRAG